MERKVTVAELKELSKLTRSGKRIAINVGEFPEQDAERLMRIARGKKKGRAFKHVTGAWLEDRKTLLVVVLRDTSNVPAETKMLQTLYDMTRTLNGHAPARCRRRKRKVSRSKVKVHAATAPS